MNGLARVGRLGIGLAVAALLSVAGWVLLVRIPADTADLLGVLLVVAVAVAGLRIGGSVGGSVFPAYNAAEVAVEGPITRDGGGGLPVSPPGSPGADDIVELIERADEDDSAEALVLKLNTPGGAVVPSDDIRLAAKAFDGPTVAYATDVCASGGYWIASGCDELWAREGSIVGSIGVRGSRMTAADLLERVGIEYEQLTAGEYKEAGVPFDDLEENEREYLQGIVDDYYEQFVETVAEGRGVDPETIRGTEAKVFLGEAAHELGLVDGLGTQEDAETRVEELLEEEIETRELEARAGVAERLRSGAERVAYAFGAGIAGRVAGDGEQFRFRF
jgi:protease-4